MSVYIMSKDRSTTVFPIPEKDTERFDIKKQGFLSIQQEKKVFHNWKKFWLVLKQSLIVVGTTPRIVLDAYSNESAFLSGGNPKQSFNLTGTVAPVAICPQGHKQVRHVFSVYPPGSRYLFECDSQFGMESWVDELNSCLFPRNTSTHQILDDIQSSIKFGGSFRNRAKSNSMNDLSKIGSDPVTEVVSAPPLPPPNKKATASITSFPASPTSPSPEVISRYQVEVEVSTLHQVPKGICTILVRKDDIQLCHAVTLECLVQWLITHIREFKLTNENKLIITSGHRSFTGYGQIRLKGEACKPLYYKVKVFVQSKTGSKSMNRKQGTTDSGTKPLRSNRILGSESEINRVLSPTKSSSANTPLSSERRWVLETQSSRPRPLPDIPKPWSSSQTMKADESYDHLHFSQPNIDPLVTTYSKLNTEENSNRWSQGDITAGNYVAYNTLPTERTNQSTLAKINTNKYNTQNFTGEYSVTNHGLNPFVDTHNNDDIFKALDSQTESVLRVVDKEKDEREFSTSYTHSNSNDLDMPLGELRKTKSLLSSKDRKEAKKLILHPSSVSSPSPYEDATPPQSDSDSDTDVEDLLDKNLAYGVNPLAIQTNSMCKDIISPYLVTDPKLEPNCK